MDPNSADWSPDKRKKRGVLMQQGTSYGEAEFKVICHNLRIPGATRHWKRQTNPFRAFGGIMALPTP